MSSANVRTGRELKLSVAFVAFWFMAASSFPQAISVGVSLTLSGPHAAEGQAYRAALEAMVSRTNERVVAPGRRIELAVMDDQGDTNRAKTNIRELIDVRKVAALAGLGSASATSDPLALAQDQNVAVIAPRTSSMGPRQIRTVFTARASVLDQTRKLASQWERLTVDRVAIIGYDDALGRLDVDAVTDGLKKSRRLISPVLIARNKRPERADWDRLYASRPDNIVVLAENVVLQELFRDMKSRSNTVPVTVLANISPDELASSPPEVARGATVIQILPPIRSAAFPLARECETALSPLRQPLSYAALEGCLAARILSEAVRRLKTNTPVSRSAMIAAVEGIGKFDAGGVYLSYSATSHHGTNWSDWFVLSRNGAYWH